MAITLPNILLKVKSYENTHSSRSPAKISFLSKSYDGQKYPPYIFNVFV